MNSKIALIPVTPDNLNAVLALAVAPHQKAFVPSPAEILSRAWSLRNDNAQAHVITFEGAPAGLILTHDVTDEPACHYIMEMMVDARFQRKGIGKRALEMLIDHISKSPRFPVIELSVDRKNTAAIALYEKAGFTDSGYTDPDLPQYINMIYKITG